ncbi:MAG: outer membrane lipoprotein carrier protein LolA [Paracoccaceae bacterium]
MTYLARTLALIVALALAPPAAAQVNQRDLLRISNYLNGLGSLEGRFVQIGPDGELSQGTFRMRRPGRLRFSYEPPNPALIVADGTWVGVCDRQIEVFDRFPLSETPLDLLLRDRVDLRSEGAVTRIDSEGGQLRVTAIDPDAPDQGSLTLVFSDVPLALRQWVVRDAQGLTTTVALRDTRSNVQLDPRLFRLDDAACQQSF